MDKKRALAFIYLFGVISLLGDIIYEGARSISGQYLGALGASAAVVGIVAGVGEFLGYFFRLISGFLSDRMNLYWLFVFIGYGLLVSVPLLSLTDSWMFASVLFILERIGKGIRSPAKDALLSEPAKKVGTGYTFGILEFIDQVGALIGPLLLFIIFLKLNSTLSKEDYQISLSVLWLPFVILALTLLFTYIKFKEEASPTSKQKGHKLLNLEKGFWLYCLFIFSTTAGFTSFTLIGYHIKTNSIMAESYIVAMYAISMAVDGLFAVLIGKIYDKFQSKKLMLYIVPPITFTAVYLSFCSGFIYVVIGLTLWGVVMAIHETIFKSYIVDTVKFNIGSAFAVFNTVYGLSMLVGSTVIAIVYQHTPKLLPVYLLATQTAALFSLMKLKDEKIA